MDFRNTTKRALTAVAAIAISAGFNVAIAATEENKPTVAAMTALAEQGDAAAQFNLGVMYANGEGVAQDDAAAVSWYRKATDQGHAAAQNNLGVMYARGTGAAQDDAVLPAGTARLQTRGMPRRSTTLV